MSNVSIYHFGDCRNFGGGGTLVAMTTETAKKKGTPQILRTDTALKLVRFSSFKAQNSGLKLKFGSFLETMFAFLDCFLQVPYLH